MRRATIVIGTTVAGLAAVLSFHTAAAPTTLSFPTGSTSSGSTSRPVATGPPSSGTGSRTPPRSGSTLPTTTAPAGSGTRTATGVTANYGYGTVSVSVTVSGSKITKIGIAALNDGGNFRSVSIDQQAVPILEQQAVQAQSANIQGVSGATYTSQGFAQSLQSALAKLGR
jgi:uncharacterized protein with FMN-binding domain